MFHEDQLYLTDDPALLKLAPYATWAHWRCEGRGPAFIKIGARVAYSGAALNAWLRERTVEPSERPGAGVRTL